MEFKRKQSTFCDSGYNSLDLDESKDDKQEDSHAEKAANVDDEEEEDKQGLSCAKLSSSCAS